jgi:hypothetical protein
MKRRIINSRRMRRRLGIDWYNCSIDYVYLGRRRNIGWKSFSFNKERLSLGRG